MWGNKTDVLMWEECGKVLSRIVSYCDGTLAERQYVAVPASVSCDVQISVSISRALVTNIALPHIALRLLLWPHLVRQFGCTVHGPFIEDCVRSLAVWATCCSTACCTDSDMRWHFSAARCILRCDPHVAYPNCYDVCFILAEG